MSNGRAGMGRSIRWLPRYVPHATVRERAMQRRLVKDSGVGEELARMARAKRLEAERR